MSSSQTQGRRTSKLGRARGRRRKPFIPSLVQLGVMIVACIILTSIMAYGAFRVIARPYILGAQQAAVLSEKKSELNHLNTENDRLARQAAYLSRPDGAEAAARTQGYLKPGEQSLIIESTPSSGAAQ